MDLVRSFVAGTLALGLAACASTPPKSFRTLDQLSDKGIVTFTDESDVDAYLAAQEREQIEITRQNAAYWARRRERHEAEGDLSEEELEQLLDEKERQQAALKREITDHARRALRHEYRASLLKGRARAAELEALERERLAMAQKSEEFREIERDLRYSRYDESIVVTASRAPDVAITNTQEAGVDEGGLVKATGDHLVILRRGRVHVVRHGDDELRPVSSIDAFPPGDEDPDDTWYDEMLLHKGMVIVIGYSYGEDGTEISRFSLSDDGLLTYRDTHYLASWDYYSSRNYASRMVGGVFYTYTPTPFDEEWRKKLPFLERRQADGTRVKVGSTLAPSGMGMAGAMAVEPAVDADVMHGITACDVFSETLSCSTRTVLGTGASEYYFSRDAAYIWTDTGHSQRSGNASRDWGSLLYRIPLDDADPITAITAKGDPVDQFSFYEDPESDSLFVVTVGEFVFKDWGSFSLQMWESEYSNGDARLLRIPLDAMGNGIETLTRDAYQPLPKLNGRVQNRFVGEHLMLGVDSWRGSTEKALFVTPLDEPWVQRLLLPHTVGRLDRLGLDGIVIGDGLDNALGFTAVEFDEDTKAASLVSTYMLPAAEEGENRSQAFYWHPEDGDPEQKDGVMALPVNKELEGFNFQFLGSSTSMFYLERKDGQLSPVGELGTVPDENVIKAAEQLEALEKAGDCKASCVDWYGNARPIFIGDRIFALMGDQIVEGELLGGRIEEVQRINFAN